MSRLGLVSSRGYDNEFLNGNIEIRRVRQREFQPPSDKTDPKKGYVGYGLQFM